MNSVLIAFTRNAETFTRAFFVFLFFPLHPSSGWTGKTFLRMFYELLPGIYVTSAGLILSESLGKHLCEKCSLNLKFCE